MEPDEIFDRYGEKMYHYLALRLGTPEDAEDVLQETFCRLARYSVRWAVVRNPKAFVFKVLRNEANRYLARRIRQRAGERAHLEDTKGLTSIFDGSGEIQPAALAEALGGLPDEQREIIILRVFQEFSFKEIASVCGLSVNTAASRYRYGIEKLRASLEGKS